MRALILGGAECVWDDVDALEDCWGGRPWEGIIIAANDVACHWPRRRSDWTIIDHSFRVDHWATLHPEKLGGWIERRAANGLPKVGRIWAHRPGPDHTIRGWEHVDQQLDLAAISPPTGLFACYVARALGVTEAILCGIPMTRTPHFASSTEHEAGAAWPYVDVYWPSWLDAHARGDLTHVRSMSGRTRDLLGSPLSPTEDIAPALSSPEDGHGSFPAALTMRVRGREISPGTGGAGAVSVSAPHDP